jgi:hypothetical protein
MIYIDEPDEKLYITDYDVITAARQGLTYDEIRSKIIVPSQKTAKELMQLCVYKSWRIIYE